MENPVYGAAIQYANSRNESPLLPPKSINCVHKIIGTLLYYAIAIYHTMLVALGSISAQQTRATEQTYDEVIWLLNYT